MPSGLAEAGFIFPHGAICGLYSKASKFTLALHPRSRLKHRARRLGTERVKEAAVFKA